MRCTLLEHLATDQGETAGGRGRGKESKTCSYHLSLTRGGHSVLGGTTASDTGEVNISCVLKSAYVYVSTSSESFLVLQKAMLRKSCCTNSQKSRDTSTMGLVGRDKHGIPGI